MTENRKYSEFFAIDESYYPEINPNSIRSKKIEWNQTFPHETFIKFMDSAARMIERKDPHSIWVEGSFGTGKSRTMWALQCLLSCSEEELKEYFDRYSIQLEDKSDLLGKLLSFKRDANKKILTLSRYDSGEIDSIQRLITAIYDTISEALVQNGYDTGGASLREIVADWLEKPKNSTVFDVYRDQEPYNKYASFQGKSASQIARELRQPPEKDDEGKTPTDELLENVLTLADQEGLKILNFQMKDLKAWLAEVIAKNNLKAIVFFWDEFTSFFKKNKDSLDVFQSLVELSSESPFYLVIATHQTGAFISKAERDDKKGPFMALYDRFTHIDIELPDNVAFDLIAEAMKIKPNSQKEYETLTYDINSWVMNARKDVCASYSKSPKDRERNEKTLQNLVPIHPVSALLLKHIATEFASNQRSMFNFIKNDDADNLQAFQWFINTHSPEQGEILTVDFLWNFFYEKGSDDHGSGVGKSNLDFIIAAILDVYPRYEDKLHTTEEKRVLKCVLMMQAISRKINNSNGLLRPIDVNIMRAFQGDFSIQNNVQAILEKLVNAKILVKMEDKKDGKTRVEYIASVMAGDGTKIDEIIERIRNEIFTSTLLREGDINDGAFGFNLSLRSRYNFEIASANNFKVQANRLATTTPEYKIPALFCFARDEVEQNELGKLLAQATQVEEWKNIVFIDASEALVGEERFEEYLSQAAQEEYWRPTDPKTSDSKGEQKRAILTDWKKDILDGSFRVATQRSGDYRTRCASKKLLEETLVHIVRMQYPLVFDDAKVTEFFFKSTQLAAGAKLGIQQASESSYAEKSIAALLGKVKGVGTYWEIYSDKPISKLKVIVDEFIKQKFESDGRVDISKIFELLEENGFMPNNLYAYLTGFLLKEYADGSKYDYSVGAVGETAGSMTVDRLGTDIGDCIKQANTAAKGFKERYISIMSPGQKRFIEFCNKVFGITSNKVEHAANNMRNRFKELAPIWCYKALPGAKGLEELLEALAEVASSRGKSDAVSSKASLFGEKLTKDALFNKFKSLFTAENGANGIKAALKEYHEGEIFSLASELGVSESALVDAVKRRISSGEASWLWDDETGKQEFDKILLEYKIMLASAQITVKTMTFKECVDQWQDFAWKLRAPIEICKTQAPQLAEFFDALECIARDRQLPEDRREIFLDSLDRYVEDIKELKGAKIKGILSDYCKARGLAFGDSELDSLYGKLPKESFLLSSVDYQNQLKDVAAEIAHNQERVKLLDKWRELTETTSPKEWASMYRTPIIALVPKDLQQDAIRLFNALENPAASSAEVKFALEFISSEPAPKFIEDLKDQEKREKAFVATIVGRFEPVVHDAEALRNYLYKKGYDKPNEWIGRVEGDVKEYARIQYFETGYEDVKREIDDMPPQEAKELLKTLVANNVEVGVSIIANKGKLS